MVRRRHGIQRCIKHVERAQEEHQPVDKALMLPRPLRVRSMQSELERRNTVGDHLPLLLVAVQLFLLVALVVRRHSHSRVLALSGRPCALVVERSETAAQFVAPVVRVEARLLDIAQVLAQVELFLARCLDHRFELACPVPNW